MFITAKKISGNPGFRISVSSRKDLIEVNSVIVWYIYNSYLLSTQDIFSPITSLKSGYFLKLIASYYCNWKCFFFPTGTENNGILDLMK